MPHAKMCSVQHGDWAEDEATLHWPCPQLVCFSVWDIVEQGMGMGTRQALYKWGVRECTCMSRRKRTQPFKGFHI